MGRGKSEAGVLDEIVRLIVEAASPERIILFGSAARGQMGQHSDLDLLVVVEDSPLGPFERDAMAYRALSGVGVAKDVQVYTRAEFEQRAALPVSFERTVKTKGKLLHVA